MPDKDLSDNLEILRQTRSIAEGFYLRGADTAITSADEVEVLVDSQVEPEGKDKRTLRAMIAMAEIANNPDGTEEEFSAAWRTVLEAGFQAHWDDFMQQVALPMTRRIQKEGGADGEGTGK